MSQQRPVVTPFFKAVWTLTLKDLREEWRGREMIGAMILYAIITVLIFSFALELDREARETSVVGVFWATVVFTSMIGLNRSLAGEKDRGTVDALLLAPINRTVLFFGKMISNLIFMLIVAVLLFLLTLILFNVSLLNPFFIITAVLGTLGFAGVGTLISSMAVHTRSREAMLPVLLLPLTMPVIIAAVRASIGIINDQPQDLWIAWPVFLAVMDVILLALAFVLFEFVVEE